jgi:hypothetical protein
VVADKVFVVQLPDMFGSRLLPNWLKKKTAQTFMLVSRASLTNSPAIFAND